MSENTLYYGDNLDILPRYVKDESVDLIYLDPPFKSNQDYNVLFAEQNGTRAAAQIKAFEDTWQWDESAARTYEEVVVAGGRVATVMLAFRTFLGENDMMAYLAMMAPRLVELRRVLKPTGSIYLHCDPTASHYLKLLMDAVFGGKRFKNEISWHYTGWNKKLSSYFERRHDILLFYAKRTNTFNSYSIPWSSEEEYVQVRKQKIRKDKRGRFYVLSDAGSGKRVKRYLKDAMQLGKPVDDIWEIDKLTSSAKERLGYPTQKPEALLDRIIRASSNEGDVVLDPFCGCGTAVAVAQRLNRNWIGIDITHLAVALIKKRLYDTFGDEVKYRVIGEPVDLSGAKELASQNKYQFQWWALGLVNARPVEQKKGADRGIDGRRYFIDGKRRKTEQIVFSVKSGGVGVKDIRDLRGVVEREKAAVGVLITLEEPTTPMKREAAAADFYHSDWRNTKHPRLQILTIEELMAGKKLDLPYLARTPAADLTFKKAPKAKRNSENSSLDFNP
jgi:DNA modification methylase